MHDLKIGYLCWFISPLGLFLSSCAGIPGRHSREAVKSPSLQRIAVHKGHFIKKDTGKIFTPQGFNYIRLRKFPGTPEALWHDTFNPERYNPDETNTLFSHLKENGFNVVRVFIDHLPKQGIVESVESSHLSKSYMNNVSDFLSRAKDAGIYVILTFPWFPDSPAYHRIDQQKPESKPYHNASFFHPMYIDIKTRYLTDFVKTLKELDPDLLNTIFAWELENETHFCIDEFPFTLNDKNFFFLDSSYDLTKPGEKQRLADDAVRNWADLCVRAFRKHDKNALVAANVFSFRAVGRSGPVSHFKENSPDRRFPARPLTLLKSSIDFLDIHLYATADVEDSLKKDLESLEFSLVKKECQKLGKPVIMGEFGAFKERFPDLNDAAKAMQKQARRSRELGFEGWLYWTYDCNEQVRLWNARSEEDVILNALRGAF
jgi:hypothetical protein